MSFPENGEFSQAVGVSRGGRTTKIHCLADACGRIVAIALTPGNIADITMALPLLEAMPPTQRLIADKAYDADRLMRPVRSTRHQTRHSRTRQPQCRLSPRPQGLCRRNVIERMFGRLKNWHRIATRYDRLAETYIVAIALVAAVTQWVE
jgi:transposase